MTETSGRLPTHLWVAALRRRVEAAGGFATVIARGDSVAGAVLVVTRDENGRLSLYQRVNFGDGEAGWRTLVENAGERDGRIGESIERQRRFDPDLWVIELDIANPARFIADEA